MNRKDIPDPHTAEGQAEIRRRIERVKRSFKDDVKRSIEDADLEPGGALTNPSELDLRRNYKYDD